MWCKPISICISKSQTSQNSFSYSFICKTCSSCTIYISIHVFQLITNEDRRELADENTSSNKHFGLYWLANTISNASKKQIKLNKNNEKGEVFKCWQ